MISVEDYKTGYVHNRYLICWFLIDLYTDTSIDKLILIVIMYILLVLLRKYHEPYIGGADLKIILIMLYENVINTLFVINISCVLALLYAFLFKDKCVRFVPFMTISYIGVLLC